MSSPNQEKHPYAPPAQPVVISSAVSAANGPFTPNGFDGGTNPFNNYNSGPI